MEPLTGPVTDPKVLIEGVLFRARYLGSTQVSKNISVFLFLCYSRDSG